MLCYCVFIRTKINASFYCCLMKIPIERASFPPRLAKKIVNIETLVAAEAAVMQYFVALSEATISLISCTLTYTYIIHTFIYLYMYLSFIETVVCLWHLCGTSIYIVCHIAIPFCSPYPLSMSLPLSLECIYFEVMFSVRQS